MKNFDPYEYAGVIAPGAVALFAAAQLYPGLGLVLKSKDFTISELGLFVILAYVAGHLMQSGGNLLEWLWWKAVGGMPSDWVRTGKGELLSSAQVEALNAQLPLRLGLPSPINIASLSAKAWYGIIRQVYAAVAAAGRSQRIDIFNGNYGLCRGIAAALLVVAVFIAVDRGFGEWKILLATLAGAVVALYRMHRFGRHYARELFVQFLQLPVPAAPAPKVP